VDAGGSGRSIAKTSSSRRACDDDVKAAVAAFQDGFVRLVAVEMGRQ
jgi:hypothetical protein